MVLGWGKKTVTKQDDEEDMTMDEILASIRKYVTEDQGTKQDLYGVPAQPIRATEPRLQEGTETTRKEDRLTDYASPYSTVKELHDTSSYHSKHQAEPMVPTPDPVTKAERATLIAEERIMEEMGVSSAQTISAAALSLSKLAELKASEKVETAGSSVTLETLFANLARPMIKEWLDEHLSQIVEKMVAKEIDRIRNYGK